MTAGGRPKHTPTTESRQMVEVLAGYGVKNEEITKVVGVTLPTLYRRYRRELDAGYAKVEAKLVGNLLRLASGKDGTALKAIMFSLQCRFGWSQYAPAPEPKLEHDMPLGKKEQANREAQTAHEDTSWGNILN
jgi:hypothetical protein